MSDQLLLVKDLRVTYTTYIGSTHAVNDACLNVKPKEAVGLVGETGCGKSTVGFAIPRLLDPSARITGGQIIFGGEDLLEKKDEDLREIRRKKISLIFQDPTAALNPVYRIGDQITEALKYSSELTGKEAHDRSVEILSQLGIPSASQIDKRYPHELSGGMRQRVMIAIALSKNPDLLIADEPTSNLDVTIQAQILDLISDLKSKTGMSVLIITHDMGVIAEACDEVGVMYAGQIVEFGSVGEIFRNPLHPYARGLIKVANLVGEKVRLEPIPGTVPDLRNLPIGCLFSQRCPFVETTCLEKRPELIDVGRGHLVACPTTRQRGG